MVRNKVLAVLLLVLFIVLLFGCTKRTDTTNDQNDVNTITGGSVRENIRNTIINNHIQGNEGSTTPGSSSGTGTDSTDTQETSAALLCDLNFPIELQYAYLYKHIGSTQKGEVKYSEDVDTISFLDEYTLDNGYGIEQHTNLTLVDKNSGKVTLYNKSTVYGDTSCTGREDKEIQTLMTADAAVPYNTCGSGWATYSCPTSFLRDSVMVANGHVIEESAREGSEIPRTQGTGRGFLRTLDSADATTTLDVNTLLPTSFDKISYTCWGNKSTTHPNTCVEEKQCLNVGVFIDLASVGGTITKEVPAMDAATFDVPIGCPTQKQVDAEPDGITLSE